MPSEFVYGQERLSLPWGKILSVSQKIRLYNYIEKMPVLLEEGNQHGMEQEESVAHVLIFPLPYQGHVNSMLKLAEVLSLAGLQVTFLNSDYNHQRLFSFTEAQSRFARFPGFAFETISDGLPLEYPRSGAYLGEFFHSLQTVTKPLFKELVISLRGRRVPVNCIISDGAMLSLTIDVAEELRVPVIAFRTISACCFWSYFCFPKLVEAGELPFSDDNLDRPIISIPGMEKLVRRRDLPSFYRAKDLSDPLLKRVIEETLHTPRACALILNTLEELEGPILSQIRTHCPVLYTIGPLHAMLNTYYRASSLLSPPPSSSNSLWKEDRSCMTWLDSQPLKSVLYVSFGSLTVVTREELLEFWHGLVSSGKRFLWVIRSDLVAGEGSGGELPEELTGGTKERGFMVEWAPQEDVLNHPVIGGFLTHSGWNSTLESVYAGVPMICWPYFADQQVNSRYVSEVWGIGMDMKDSCDRIVIADMVRQLMDENRGQGLRQNAEKIAKEARLCVTSENEGGNDGSSYANLNKLIRAITTNKFTFLDDAATLLQDSASVTK